MSVIGLPRYYVHVNKFGNAVGEVFDSPSLCNPHLKYQEFFKVDEAIAESKAESDNRIKQLKDEIAAYYNVLNNTLDTDAVMIDGVMKKLRELLAI